MEALQGLLKTNADLEAYFAEHILGPLGMADTTFVPDDARNARRSGLHMRLPDGGLFPMDAIAAHLGLDRAEVRSRNFIQPDEMPYDHGLMFQDGRPLKYDSGDFPASLAKLKAMRADGGIRAWPVAGLTARVVGMRVGFEF